ncbi:hypothetical protein DV737_g2534, partial [Chaetothyriales sp. CBS 132003]
MAKTTQYSSSNKMLRFAGAQRNLLAAVVVFCLVAVIYSGTYLVPHSPQPDLVHPTTDSLIHPGNDCDPVSVPAETVVIIKTGANEIYDKLPTQLLTALRCYDDLLFFSDLEQNLGPYVIHDALSDVTESVQKKNPQFDYYHMLQEYSRNGQDISALREQTGDAAWILDKYKFLHILEKTWKLRPHRKWYVYIEADTYLIQSNLQLWLERLDSSKPLYFGSPTYINGEAFSHGGSGFILSGVALSQFADGDEGVAARYDKDMQNEQFGDYVLMKALRDKGVKFSPVWPMLQAEKPSTIPFGPGPDNGVRHWCQPVVTMHHITPNEASQIWTFEQQRRDAQTPLLFKDLYEGMIAPEVHAERDDWYNLSDDLMYRAPGLGGDRQKAEKDMTPVEKEAHLSFEHCRRACDEQDRCWQFVYYNQTCGFSYSYRLGEKRAPDKDGKPYKSGWALAKIARDQNANACDSALWLG